MEPAERLTVVIPTFDRPAYFEECLGSVADQTCKGFRLVVLDNASSSDYSSVLKGYAHVPLEYVRNETPRPGGNIVTAIRHYDDTDYLTVFHDDDLMHPRMLELQLELLEAHPDIQFVATEFAMFIDSDLSPKDAWEDLQPVMEIYDDVAALARALLGGASLCFGSTMYRSSVLCKIGFDAARFSIYCDRPYLMDAARQGKCALIKAPLVLYRVHPGQDTNTGSLGIGNLIELMKSYRAALPKDWDKADQELFYQHSKSFLVNNQGYGRLAAGDRHGAIVFLWRSWANGVVRLRDLRLSDFATLARADGWGSQVDGALAAKRWLSRRRCSVAASGGLNARRWRRRG